MNKICEICNITNLNTCSDYRLSISEEIINDSYTITKDTVHDFNTMSMMADAISSRRANGCLYLRLIFFWQNEYQNMGEDSTLFLKKNYIKYFNFNSIPNRILHLNLSRNILDRCLYLPEHLISVTLSNNKIMELPKLPDHLESLGATNCGLVKLPELPATLKKLSVKDNDIKTFPDSFILCTNLQELKYENNNNLYLSREQLDFIEQTFERLRVRQNDAIQLQGRANNGMRNNVGINITPTVYNYGQNVHNNKIHDGIEKSIQTLIQTCNITIEDYTFMSKEWKSMIQKFIKRLSKLNINDDFIEDIKEMIKIHPGTHSQIKLSFSDLFILWLYKIDQFKDDIFKEIVIILQNDIQEMNTVCLTGKIGRLINSLSGFSDEVEIGITVNQQLTAKQHTYNKKLENVKQLNENDKYLIILHWLYIDYYMEKKSVYSIKDKVTIDEWLQSLHELVDFDTVHTQSINDYYNNHKIDNKCSLEELRSELIKKF
jgi:hypothetical protein